MPRRKSKSDGYTSKGLHNNVSKNTLKAVKRDLDPTIKMNHIITAWRKGLNPWITINNPNKKETNKRYIKIKSNISWGNPNKPVSTGKTSN
tara:strand:- start:8943 stop:9215 length:273 start_codon:yes stop_codon:yes gene_type:complete